MCGRYYIAWSAAVWRLSWRLAATLECHAERNGEEREAILTMESKHPYPAHAAGTFS